MKGTEGKKLSPADRDDLLGILKTRFEKNMQRHKGMVWTQVQARLEPLQSVLAESPPVNVLALESERYESE